MSSSSTEERVRKGSGEFPARVGRDPERVRRVSGEGSVRVHRVSGEAPESVSLGLVVLQCCRLLAGPCVDTPPFTAQLDASTKLEE